MALTPDPTQEKSGEKARLMLLALRQALIIALGAVEVYLDLPRSIVPKHERNNARYGR